MCQKYSKSDLDHVLIRVYGHQNLIKTDSVQSSSNMCKNYLLKIYSQHGNFLNVIENMPLKFSSLSDPAMKSLSILEESNVKPRKNAKSECYCVFN